MDDSVLWRAWLSQHLLPPITVAVELRLPEALPATVAELCDQLGCGSARVLLALLGVLTAQRLLVHGQDGRYRLTATGSALLRRSPTFAGPYLLSSAACASLHDRCKEALLAPDHGGEPTATSAAWASGSLGGDAHRAQAMLIHMHALNAPTAMRAASTLVRVARQCLRNAERPRRLRMLDAGGGSGVFAVCVAKACHDAEVDVGDLPDVIAQARLMGYVPSSVESRVRLRPLDLFGAWPPGAHDAHLLSSVVHDWDDAQCAALLRQSHAALPPGGVVLLHEVLLPDAAGAEAGARAEDDAETVAACLSLHMALYSRGKQRTAQELQSLLTAAGFGRCITLPTAGYFSVTVGVKDEHGQGHPPAAACEPPEEEPRRRRPRTRAASRAADGGT